MGCPQQGQGSPGFSIRIVSPPLCPTWTHFTRSFFVPKLGTFLLHRRQPHPADSWHVYLCAQLPGFCTEIELAVSIAADFADDNTVPHIKIHNRLSGLPGESSARHPATNRQLSLCQLRRGNLAALAAAGGRYLYPGGVSQPSQLFPGSRRLECTSVPYRGPVHRSRICQLISRLCSATSARQTAEA